MFRGTGWNALLQQDSICLIVGKWTINGVGVTEHDIHDVIARKYSHYPEQIIEKAMRYIKTHWDEDVTREMSREINREIIRMEKTLTENTKIPVRSKDEHDEAEMYCLLGEICERAAEHQIAAFWFKSQFSITHSVILYICSALSEAR